MATIPNADIKTIYVKIIAIHGTDAVDPPYNVPTCTPTFLQVNLSEATSVNTIIVPALGCTDADDPSTPEGTLLYKMLSGKAARFDVDANTGAIKLKKKFNADFQKYYFVEVEVYDQGVPSQTAIVGVSIYLFSVNDNAPKITNLPASITVDEMSAPGTLITSCTLSDKDSGSGGLAGEVRIEITGDTSILGVDVTSGEVTLNSPVDYESGQVEYSLIIDVKDTGLIQYTASVEVKVTVTDVDDHDPTWTSTSVFTTSAIVVTAALDRETLPVVEFDITAYSSNNEDKNITAHVTITLTDVNDEEPSFTLPVYAVTLPENSASGSTAGTVTANDPDDGAGGQVEYSIDGTFFNIDVNSGVVTITDILVTGTDHVARVTAVDKGVPSLTSQCMIVLTVTPVNDYTPTFSPLPTQNIPEDTQPGTTVLQITATDADVGVDGDVVYSLQDPSVPFLIDSASGEIITRLNLDRETNSTWDVVVIATDKSTTSPKSSSVTVQFDITDVNDNVAICDPVPTIIVPKPYTTGTTLTALVCVDDDADVNAELIYTIAAGDSGVFGVDATGSLKLSATPTSSSYALMIAVTDKGASPLSTQVPVLVFVEVDLSFTNLPASVNKLEDVSAGEPVMKVQACCSFSTLVYEIASGNTGDRFGIDQYSGQIYVLADLDREDVANYSIGIRVRTFDSSQSTDSSLDIILNDVNDNDPVFGATFTKIPVVESINVTTGIQMISATDADFGVNADLTYVIVSGNVDNTFIINPSGMLILDKPLDAETLSAYTLTISATDGGILSRSGETTVLVEVTDVDEHPIDVIGLVNGAVNTSVDENAVLGTHVYQIVAQDLDISSQLTYVITSGNDGTFLIYNGFITLLKLLDRETKDLYVFSVNVSNQINDTVAMELTIVVNDVNDNDPKFNQTLYSFELHDGVTVGASVGTVNVSDLDIGTNAKIDLTIMGGNDGDVFELDGNTIKTKGTVDYTTQKQYTLDVRASDNGPTIRSSKTAVIISILQNLVIPEFGPNSLSITLDENTVVKTPITDLNATVSGANEDDLVYSIQNGNTNNSFHIHESTGEVYIAGQLDFEATQQYNLVIQATRRDNSSSTDTITLDIIITNLNDNPPIFSMPVYEMTTPEGSNVGTTVGQVVVSDGDGGTLGQVTMAMSPSSGSTDFTFDPVSGYLTVAVVTEYSRQGVYYMAVVATDGGSPARSSTAVVVVKVEDTNNHTPEFSDTVYSFPVIETMPVNDEVYTVRATDADAGLNAKLTYQITSGNDAGVFVIDAETGVLRTGQMTVTVRVTPVANSVISTFDFAILENSAIGSSVGEVTPHGSHRAGAVVTFSIVSGNFDSLFAITKMPNGNGEITLTKQPDRETYSQFVLTVNELDDNSLSEDRIVKITILDENDNDPVFPTSTLNIKVVENSPAGFVVSTITATDPDDGTNGQITYSIPTSYVAGNGLFQIDNSGVLSVKDPADFESNPVVNFAISATDGGGRSGEITLVIDIVDVAETVIEADTSGTSAFISAEVPDTAATGAAVITLTLDAFGLNPVEVNSVKYVTVSGGGVVSVNEDTGVVTVKDSGKLFKDTRHFEWVICQAVNVTSGQSLAVLGLVRVDCFEAARHMIVITFSDTKDVIELNRQGVRSHIQSFFLSTQYAGIWEVRQEGTSARRRLLAAQSSAQVYVVADPSVNSLSGAQSPKQFLTQQAVLQVLQSSSDGTPVAGLSSGAATVDQVMPYDAGTTSAAAVFTASPVGITVIALAAAVGLVILILIVTCIIWRLKKKARDNNPSVTTPHQTKGFKPIFDTGKSNSHDLPGNGSVSETTIRRLLCIYERARTPIPIAEHHGQLLQ
ncbi:protocadherin Fat 4-like [Haliotis rubra]|uniref:protocadherin Fat 4-like n=1 Tax=Haliotis rubra TaxID=36100 RepID=UPI001EE512FE|nr:protocadherin Fat 4-like [Haliotis rubra]